MNKFLCFCFTLFCLLPAKYSVLAAPAMNPYPVVEMDRWQLLSVNAIEYSQAHRKIYVAALSAVPSRNGLLVFDVDEKGRITGEPRRFAEHPDTPPSTGRRTISSMLLTRYNTLVLGIDDPRPEATRPVVIYQLDARGEPTGAPLAYNNGNPQRRSEALALHPKLPRLYSAGWGPGGFGVFDLDAKGKPSGEATWHDVGGIGKRSIALRSDGSKLYLGSHPYVLEVVDLDAAGNPTSRARPYAVRGGGKLGYLVFTANDKAIYYPAPDGGLGYFLLDEKGEPKGEAQSVAALPTQAVSAGNDRIVVATPSGFNDALNDKWIQEATQLQEWSVKNDGAPDAMLSESTLFERRTATAINAKPGTVLALSAPQLGFLGNRFHGLRVRATLATVQAAEPMLPAFASVQATKQQKYLRFVHSPSRGMIYGTGEDSLWAYAVGNHPENKIAVVPCPGVGDAVAIDDGAGVLYAARKDGTIAVRKLDATGVPAASGEEWASGIKPVNVLAVHPKSHHVYALGQKDAVAASESTLPSGGRIIPVVSEFTRTAAAVDVERSRLYSTGFYAPANLVFWKLTSDGKLLDAEPQRIPDAFPPDEKKSRGMLYALRLDTKKRKLYVGGNRESQAAGQARILVYDLNESGDVIGAPRVYKSANKSGSLWAIELSPNGSWLYESGWGDGNVYAHRLNASGEPSGTPVAWATPGSGKGELLVAANASTLLMGSHPSIIESIRLAPDGDAVRGLKADFTIERKPLPLGFLAEGIPSPWLDLDSILQNSAGSSLGRLQLSGAPVTKAQVRFEVALEKNGRMQPVRTVTTDIAGNVAALYVPRYGERTSDLPQLVQNSEERFQQYWAWARPHAISAAERPRQFVVSNGLIGLDSNPASLDLGLATLAALGHNTARIWGFPNLAPAAIRKAAAKHGINQFGGAVYTPPSYFDYDRDLMSPQSLDKWAASQTHFSDIVGAAKEDLKLFHIGDEPGWYYPNRIEAVKETPERLAVFREYLKAKGMTPELLGKASWNQVMPIKPGEIKSLPDKRLHFWTVRFFAESFSKGFAAATQAMQRQLNSRILTTTNLNNWPGSYYIPSPGAKIANNPDAGPDAGMGAPDWFDLGRKKAISAIWSEDWFGDWESGLWSFWSDLLRSAAREGPIEFGSYVIGGRLGTSEIPDGGKYKIMALAGHGAKAIDPYIFCPSDAFGDGWADGHYHYKPLADGLRMLGKSEKLLYPGRPRTGTVAILFPQSSQAWDPDAKMRYHMWELYGLHAGLIHENYPVDFIDDFGVENGDLQKYKYSVLYVSAPNLSLQAQRQILDWVQAGGTVVLLPGAAAADEYNEPTDLLWKAGGAVRSAVPRDAIPPRHEAITSTPVAINIADERLTAKAFTTHYQTAPLTPTSGKALANFEGGKAAVVAAMAGKGRVLSFGYWPGVSYWNSPERTNLFQLPDGWAHDGREVLTSPARFAGAKKHVEVSHDIVEGILLESDKGVAVTLLNWTNAPLEEITVTIPGAGKFAKVESVEQGVLAPQRTAQGLTVKLPLKTVDVILLSR